MDRDLRQSPLFQEIETFYRNALEPGFGRATDFGNPAPSPDGQWVVAGAQVRTSLTGPGQQRLVLAAVDGSGSRLITNGPGDDQSPQWSPDGTRLTFVSDRLSAGRFQLYELRLDQVGEAVALSTVPGVVEHHRWSVDGRRILLVVAGEGAEQADALGSGTLGSPDDLPAWMPEVVSSDSDDEWRSLWILDVESGVVRRVSREGLNVWEACWVGEGSAAAIISEAPGEGAWYHSPLAVIDLATGQERVLYRSEVQLGYAEGSADGRTIAVLQAVCSDRYIVVGDLLLVDVASGAVRTVDTSGVDISCAVWAPDGSMTIAGTAGLDSVVLSVNPEGRADELFRTSEGLGTFNPEATPVPGGFVAAISSARRPPALVSVVHGIERELVSGRHDGHETLRSAWGSMEPVAWTAPDGWAMEGLLATPAGPGPYALLVAVHGGPVGQFLDWWPSTFTQLLLARGYAIFSPNPRGSTGRGQAFAAAVVGDMGGADASDITSGIDSLVDAGVADPDRIGIFGGSYGGFMAAWLPAVDERFKAAVSLSPVTDWYSEHFGSSLIDWVGDFIGDRPENQGGAHHERSPVFAGDRLRTPTLLTAGLRDKATPPGQAIEHHRALVAQGVASDVVIYPLEGHGVSALEAEIDLATRTVAWFERFMPA